MPRRVELSERSDEEYHTAISGSEDHAPKSRKGKEKIAPSRAAPASKRLKLDSSATRAHIKAEGSKARNQNTLDDDDDLKSQGDSARDGISIKEHSLSSQSVSVDANTWRRGSVVRIRIHNFVTYTDADIRPGPRLNVVLGPNGTGKSSIVCALCIGLGGAPSLLGRQAHIKEFVKRGASTGFVEIELFDKGPGRNQVIKRIIGESKKDWTLNGKMATVDEVRAVTDSMHIQVDNLCHFLPQDKVSSFAALNPVQLLRETEKAVSEGDNLLEMHDRLIFLKSVEKKSTRALDEKKHKLGLDLAQLAQLEADVARYKDREKWIHQGETLRKKLTWLIFDGKRKDVVAVKARVAAAEEELREREQSREPMVQRLKEAELERVTHAESERSLTQEALRFRERRRKHNATIYEQRAEWEKCHGSLSALAERQQRRLRELAAARHNVDKLRADAAALEFPVDQLNAALAEKSSSLRDLQRRQRDLEEQKVQAGVDYRAAADEYQKNARILQQMDDIQLQRRQMLYERKPQLLQARNWIDAHPELFRFPVHGPVCLDINGVSELHARYFSSIVPAWLMFAFVPQCVEDQQLLYREVVGTMKNNISVSFSSASIEATLNRPPRVPKDRVRAMGISHWLSETFQTHPHVMAVLCENAQIDNVGCGDETAQAHAEQLIGTGLSMFLTPASIYKVTRSAYGKKQASTSVRSLGHASPFLKGVDEKARADLQDKTAALRTILEERSAQMKELQETETALQREINGVKVEYDQITARSEKHRLAVGRLRRAEEASAQLSREEDTSAEEAALRAQIATCSKKRARALAELSDAIAEQFAKESAVDRIALLRADAERELLALKEEDFNAQQALRHLRENVAQLTHSFQVAKAEVAELKRKAEKEAPLSEQLKAEFEKLPSDIDGVNLAIAEAEAKAAVNLATNGKVIEEYNKRKKEADLLQRAVQEEEAGNKSHAAELEMTKSKWLPKVSELVKRIGEKFEYYFKEINCCGQVVLGTNANDDFEKYNIEVSVSYRANEKMCSLNSHTQSGGERSVATMLFLLAMQHFTPCAFRLVDEINQAMDPHNERMIFSQVVAAATQPLVPQYFLVTPKLLPDLVWNHAMTMLCVYNGPYMVPPSMWNQEDGLKKTIEKLRNQVKQLNRS